MNPTVDNAMPHANIKKESLPLSNTNSMGAKLPNPLQGLDIFVSKERLVFTELQLNASNPLVFISIPKASRIRVNQMDNPFLNEGEVADASEEDEPLFKNSNYFGGHFCPAKGVG